MTDLIRKRGDTFADGFTIKSETTGAAIDITGYTFKMTVDIITNPPDATTKLFSITGTIVDAPNGKVEFAPTAVQTDRVGVFYFDIQMTDPAGRIRTIDLGKYQIKQDITK